jgi:amino acid adenylation domain-containing protein
MSSAPTPLEELRNRAKTGDPVALQELRDRGFFRKKRAARDGYPVSHAQRRLWIVNQMLDRSSSAAYNVPAAFKLEGKLDRPAFRGAWEAIVKRHESLRTTFASLGGEIRQLIHDDVDFRIEETDLSRETNAEERAHGLAREHAFAPFDLEKGPLLRAGLIRLATDQHLFLFNIHHIVCDAWSQGIMVRELSTLYQAFVKGEGDPLPPLAIHYKDYTAWQNSRLTDAETERHRFYWHKKLAGQLPVLNFPADYPRPPLKTYNAQVFNTTLDLSLVEGLKQLSLKHATSLFMTLVAALKTLLYRYTGQDDIIVGCPIAGREHPDLQDQIGFYVNTLVLRDHVGKEDTFTDVLNKVRQTATEAYEHKPYPFDRLVNELSLERDVSRSPLFDVSVNLTNIDPEEFRLGEVRVSPYDSEFSAAKVDLSFDFSEAQDKLQCSIIYSSDLFREEKIRNLAGHFTELVRCVLAGSEQPISRLNILTGAERKRLLDEVNGTAAEYPGEKTLVDLFEQQAQETPALEAVTFEGKRITYTELNRRANQLAHYLARRGVGPEVMVGLYVERSIEMLVALWGILKAGGAYVPLDPSYPLERLANLLEDTQVPMIVTQELLEEKLPAHWSYLLCLETEWEEIARESEENPVNGAAPGNPAYVIYTSGSTGKPKGVVVPHHGMSNLSQAQKRLFDVRPGNRVLQFASLNFDASIFEITMALTAGATLCLGNRNDLLPGPPLMRFLTDQGITIATLPPTALAALPQAELPALQTLIVAGEACPAELMDRWASSRRFFNLYGPTESTIWATQVLYQGNDRPPSIGKPIANTQIYLLDADLQLVPFGVPGEIFIGGAGLARGYLNRPDLSAERFVPDSMSRMPGGRLYRTGDIAQFLPDGSLEFLGRSDAQVKVRGFRIELGEIEAVLSQHPGLSDVAVLAREDHPGEKRLVAYVVPAGDQSPGVEELRAYLLEKLPDFMIPAAFVTLEALPLTPNAKLDRKALPAPDSARPQLEKQFIAPRTDIEKVLAGIYAELLGVEQVGVADNFFELGGHSLLATQVISRVREFFNVEVPLPWFFKGGTVAELALVVQSFEGNKEQVEKISRALEKLKGMSEEEKRTMLAKKREAFLRQSS